jgi:hypothetical protein
MGGEAIIRLQAGPTWTAQPTDYWAPVDWLHLDNTDTDLGGVSATVIDVPGAIPSQLVLALGKDHNAYLVNRKSIAIISAASARRWHKLLWAALTGARQLLYTILCWEHILPFITTLGR